MADKIDGSIRVISGKGNLELSPEEISSSLEKIADSLENCLPPGMKEVIISKPKLQIPNMATGTVIPLSVILKELECKRDSEEIAGLVVQELLDKRQTEINSQPITYREKGGAPCLKEYDDAWQEMQAGVLLDSAYQNYLKRFGMTHSKLEKDKFRNAMKRRKNKTL